MFSIAKIVEHVMGFIDDLDLSKRDVLAIICVLGFAATAWSAVHYKGKANKLESVLNFTQTTLRIERNKPKLEDNMVWINTLVEKNIALDKEREDLRAAYDALTKEDAKPNDYMEKLKDVKTTKDICDRFDDIGHSICDDISDCRN